MDAFDYLLTFAAIVLALAVGDIVLSLNRLLAAGRQVKWDWLAPLAGVMVLLKIITQWWAWYPVKAQASQVTYELFVLLIASVAVLFLMAAAVFPDEASEGVDLKAHFERVSRRFFLLLAAHYPLVWLFVWGLSARSDFPPFQWQNPGNLAPFAALALAFIRNRWAQGGFLALMSGLYLWQGFGHGLPG